MRCSIMVSLHVLLATPCLMRRQARAPAEEGDEEDLQRGEHEELAELPLAGDLAALEQLSSELRVTPRRVPPVDRHVRLQPLRDRVGGVDLAPVNLPIREIDVQRVEHED